MLFWTVVTVLCIEADYVVYILVRLPLISQCFINALDASASGWCTERVNTVGVPNAYARGWYNRCCNQTLAVLEKWNHLCTASVIASIKP